MNDGDETSRLDISKVMISSLTVCSWVGLAVVVVLAVVSVLPVSMVLVVVVVIVVVVGVVMAIVVWTLRSAIAEFAPLMLRDDVACVR